MALEVKLEVFEGPLDLLLHLIEKNKVDIYDIPIVEITEQYLDYIRQMQTEDMNVMSEFLLMAATLLDIKCRMLLPVRSMKRARKKIREQSWWKSCWNTRCISICPSSCGTWSWMRRESFYREKDVPREVEAYRPPLDYNELLKDMTLAKLQEIFEGILKRQEDKKDPVRSNFGRIEKDEVSVDQKAVYVEDFIRTHKRFSFRALLEKQHSKVEVIVTFLVVLELMKTGKITVEQASINDDMTVISREEQMA